MAYSTAACNFEDSTEMYTAGDQLCLHHQSAFWSSLSFQFKHLIKLRNQSPVWSHLFTVGSGCWLIEMRTESPLESCCLLLPSKDTHALLLVSSGIWCIHVQVNRMLALIGRVWCMRNVHNVKQYMTIEPKKHQNVVNMTRQQASISSPKLQQSSLSYNGIRL